jgi:tetratricopeptide (TPR) repeat protein
MAELELVCEVNLRALNKLEDGPKKENLKASILSHQAQAAESLGEPVKAIELNKQAYEIRLQEKPCMKLMLCYTANNLGYCHNTANLHEGSEEWYEKSREWWELMVKEGEETCDRPARHIKNHARCLIYLGKYDKAKEMFKISIPRLKTEKPLNWAMLA